ncbi:unnamed protein product [Trichogramma brassicae]|uniref:Uncharacterized protein n=1 Tax=Trichogramma brassicae TaxID=86971 RepID=A0A6H5I564_9HYME|nr:unnamed protein product [Trichogramma brassicae]
MGRSPHVLCNPPDPPWIKPAFSLPWHRSPPLREEAPRSKLRPCLSRPYTLGRPAQFCQSGDYHYPVQRSQPGLVSVRPLLG